MTVKQMVEEIYKKGCNKGGNQDLRIERIEKDYNGLGKKVDDNKAEFNTSIKECNKELDEKVGKLHSRINQILLLAIVQLCALAFFLLKR